MDRLVCNAEWKGAASDSGSLVGYASTFGNLDRQGDVVMPGAFDGSLARLNSEGIPLLADHLADTGSVLGTIYAATEDGHGLRITARFASTPKAQEVRTLLLEGHLSRMSIGYETVTDEWAERDGKRVRLITAAELWEVSVVVFPANNEAVVTGAKSRSTPRDNAELDLDLALSEAQLELLGYLDGIGVRDEFEQTR